MSQEVRKPHSQFSLDGEKLGQILKDFFSYTGEIDRGTFAKGVIFPTILGFFSLFWFAIPFMHSLFLLGAVASLSSLIVRRLRSIGYTWAIVFIGVIPFIGWVALSVIVILKARAEDHDQVPFLRPFASAVTTFLALTLIFSSLTLTRADTSSLSVDSSQSLNGGSAEIDNIAAAAEEQAAIEAAEEARLADEADIAAAEAEEARLAGEAAAIEAQSRETELAQIDQTFEQLVASLRVEPEFSGGYNRDLFKHWIDESGNGCDTRREVLIAESLTPVSLGSRCSISGGSWYSAFDGVTTTNASSFDVDHFVPLAEAWRSGAHAWDSNTRQRFANDLGYEMSLVAVSASSNRSKGDRDPAKWMPPKSGFKCEYVYYWVNIKLRWSLSVDQSELTAINSNWSGCSTSSLNLSPSPSQAPISTAPAPTPAPKTEAAPPTSGTSPAQPPASEGCVNINSASFEELQQIVHIGPEKATHLISLRPFSSVGGLARINGISADGVRLAEIRAQGLACIG